MIKTLIYLANQRIPTEKAYGIQITKMCEAFAEQNVNVKLVIPTRNNLIEKDIFDYYGVKRNFEVIKLFSLDFYLYGSLDKLAVILKNFLSSKILFLYALSAKADIIYSRDEIALYLLSFFKNNLAFEAHKFSSLRFLYYRRFLKIGVKTVVISGGLRDEFVKFGFNPNNVLIAHDGVDLEEFNLNITKDEARGKIGLLLDKKIVLYAGQLFDWKGADIAAKAAKMMPGCLFVFVGGVGEYIDNFKNKFGGQENIVILGQKPHKDIPVYLKAADILVLPNSGKEDVSKLYTSPLKMFEYMASGRPIVASELPSLKEILNENNAILVKSDDASSLADGIKIVLTDDILSTRIAQIALEDVKKYSWQERANSILQFIQ